MNMAAARLRLRDLLRQQQRRAAGAPAVVLERRTAAGRVHRDSAQELAQLLGAVGVEPAVSAVAEAGDLAERLGRRAVPPLVEDEDGHTEQPELAGPVAERVDVLLHAVADENHGVDLLPLALGQSVSEDLPDLRLAAEAAHGRHL